MTTHSLVGRDAELDVLTGMVSRVGDRGCAIIVLGEPGVGKSSLLQATAEYSRSSGLQVLQTTGIETEAQLPFAGLHQVVRPLLDSLDQLPQAQRQAIRAAFGGEVAAPPERFMIALAALNLITEAAARTPVLVVVDDVHWLDRPTQEVLTFVARRIPSDPVILAGGVRTGHDVPLASSGLAEMQIASLDHA